MCSHFKVKTLNLPFWILRSIDILSRKNIIFHHIHSIRFHHHSSGPTSSHANGIHLVWVVRFRDWLEEKPFVEDRSKGFFFSFFPSPLSFVASGFALLQLLQNIVIFYKKMLIQYHSDSVHSFWFVKSFFPTAANEIPTWVIVLISM